jgi:hypothetical protein
VIEETRDERARKKPGFLEKKLGFLPTAFLAGKFLTFFKIST